MNHKPSKHIKCHSGTAPFLRLEQHADAYTIAYTTLTRIHCTRIHTCARAQCVLFRKQQTKAEAAASADILGVRRSVINPPSRCRAFSHKQRLPQKRLHSLAAGLQHTRGHARFAADNRYAAHQWRKSIANKTLSRHRAPAAVAAPDAIDATAWITGKTGAAFYAIDATAGDRGHTRRRE